MRVSVPSLSLPYEICNADDLLQNSPAGSLMRSTVNGSRRIILGPWLRLIERLKHFFHTDVHGELEVGHIMSVFA